MIVRTLDHVAIHVENVERSCSFYSEALQLQSIPRPAFTFPGAWFQLGEYQQLHIIGERKQPVVSQSRGNHFALLVDDINAWEQHLATGGYSHYPRRIRPDGAYQIFVTDPDGHVIELCTPPGQAAAGRSS